MQLALTVSDYFCLTLFYCAEDYIFYLNGRDFFPGLEMHLLQMVMPLFYRSEAAIMKLEREAKIYKWKAFVGVGGLW